MIFKRKRVRERVRGHHHEQGLGFRWSTRAPKERRPQLKFGKCKAAKQRRVLGKVQP
jgi:hypothetical protein